MEGRAGACFACIVQRSAVEVEFDHATRLAQELAVQVLDEDGLDARLGQAVRAVHRDELPADALQLRECHGCCGELEGLLDVWDADLAAALAGVVFLVGCDLGENIGSGLVELVEVVLLCSRFLLLLVTSAIHVR
jgi:hypothetical protein